MVIRQHMAVTAVFYCDLGIWAAGLLDPMELHKNEGNFSKPKLFWAW